MRTARNGPRLRGGGIYGMFHHPNVSNVVLACNTMGCTTEACRDKCQSIYRNLLKARGLSDVSSAYVRELQETARCDGLGQDMSEVRAAYRTFMGEKAFSNVMMYKEDALDDKKAAQAVMHYQDWTDRQLVAGLSWPNKAWFYTFLKGEQTLAAAGLVTTLFAGWRAVQYATRSWKDVDRIKQAAVECASPQREACT